ncbi:MAG: hypothetical protein SPD93_09690 [Lachnospiraceae bacterium]|nr:hypothetical protein [Lachnospiraceae bacterium]
MKNNFIKCGIYGWCMELLWTGFLAFRRREMKLFGRSSLWMFPIYGMASVISPLGRLLKNKNIWIRGTIYAIAIFCVEFLTGSFLKKRGICPWDYSDSRFHYKGLIRLDYYPLWFLAGLFFERMSRKS